MRKEFQLILSIAVLAISILFLFVVRQHIRAVNHPLYDVLAEGEETNQRHSLDVVWCAGPDWKMKAGCCLGSGDCDIVNPCGSAGYTCDGNIIYLKKDVNQ